MILVEEPQTRCVDSSVAAPVVWTAWVLVAAPEDQVAPAHLAASADRAASVCSAALSVLAGELTFGSPIVLARSAPERGLVCRPNRRKRVSPVQRNRSFFACGQRSPSSIGVSYPVVVASAWGIVPGLVECHDWHPSMCYTDLGCTARHISDFHRYLSVVLPASEGRLPLSRQNRRLSPLTSESTCHIIGSHFFSFHQCVAHSIA